MASKLQAQASQYSGIKSFLTDVRLLVLKALIIGDCLISKLSPGTDKSAL